MKTCSPSTRAAVATDLGIAAAIVGFGLMWVSSGGHGTIGVGGLIIFCIPMLLLLLCSIVAYRNGGMGHKIMAVGLLAVGSIDCALFVPLMF